MPVGRARSSAPPADLDVEAGLRPASPDRQFGFRHADHHPSPKEFRADSKADDSHREEYLPEERARGRLFPAIPDPEHVASPFDIHAAASVIRAGGTGGSR